MGLEELAEEITLEQFYPRCALGQGLAKGQLRVRLGLVVGLGEAARAHQQLESRATVGRVVLRVP